jgi:hypothetical protein
MWFTMHADTPCTIVPQTLSHQAGRPISGSGVLFSQFWVVGSFFHFWATCSGCCFESWSTQAHGVILQTSDHTADTDASATELKVQSAQHTVESIAEAACIDISC